MSVAGGLYVGSLACSASVRGPTFRALRGHVTGDHARGAAFDDALLRASLAREQWRKDVRIDGVPARPAPAAMRRASTASLLVGERLDRIGQEVTLGANSAGGTAA